MKTLVMMGVGLCLLVSQGACSGKSYYCLGTPNGEWFCFLEQKHCDTARGMAKADGTDVSECKKTSELYCVTPKEPGADDEDAIVCAPSQSDCDVLRGRALKEGGNIGDCKKADNEMQAKYDKTIKKLVAMLGLGNAEDGKKMAKKSKTSEAQQFVKKLYDGARAYYMDQAGRSMGMMPTPRQFPGPSVGPTPPLGACCQAGGKCNPDPTWWVADTWVALQFSVDDPHYYSYEYKVNSEGCGQGGKCEFTVSAYGDLDCDGEYSTFRMTGVVNDEFADGPAGTAAIYRENELE